ncbi:MAG TPA: porin [Gemmataceae bacterium]|jgi:phosphate-selective porin OprO/OprP
MDRNWLRVAPFAAAFVFFVGWMTILGDAARGQDGAEPAPPLTISPDEPMDRVSRIEARLRDLETHNQQLQQRYDDLERKYARLSQQAKSPVFGAEAHNPDGQGVPGGVDLGLDWLRDKMSGSEEEEEQSEYQGGVREQSGEGGAGVRIGGGSATGSPRYPFGQPSRLPFESERPSVRVQSGTGGGAGVRVAPVSGQAMGDYVEQRGPYVPDMRPLGLAASAQFREGLQIRTTDEFFTFEFHNLSQLDYRQFSQTGDALHDNFIVPRQRWYFQGDVTPYATYYTVINRGYGSLDILDSWVDFSFAPKYKEQFQFRVGRMKTPFTYEYIKMSESDLIAPERSLFVTNFADNREEGAMVHGRVFDGIMEYYVGVFNGGRRSFQDFNNSKDVLSFFNFRPFINTDIGWLKYLNIGGSIGGGNQRSPTQPEALTTANDQSPSSSAAIINVSPTFLIFNSKAFENGMRVQWSGDVAHYYKSFTMLAGYQGGFQDYSLQGSGTSPSTTVFGDFASGAFVGIGSSKRTRVPLTGWSVAATYFLTGEEISRRVYLTEPIRPFGYYNGRLNPGAIEVYSRIANLQLGDEVFTGGIANPAFWANRATALDTGVNWYWNHYVRLYFDWQHSMFNRPVFLSNTKSSKHNDLFWIRTQVFF